MFETFVKVRTIVDDNIDYDDEDARYNLFNNMKNKTKELLNKMKPYQNETEIDKAIESLNQWSYTKSEV